MNYDDELRQSPVAIGRDGDFAKLKVAKSGYTKKAAPLIGFRMLGRYP